MSMLNMKVAVAGASGLMGMHFVEALVERGASVRAIIHRTPLPAFGDRIAETVTADLCDADSCRAAFRGMDAVVLGAAFVAGAKIAIENPMMVVTENLIVAARMLEAAVQEGVSRVLLISSSTTYPHCDRPIREDEWAEPPVSIYQGIGNVKRFQETLANFYHDRYGLKVAIIRSAPAYGAFDHFDPDRCHVIPALIRRALEGGSPFPVWGDGNDVRNFVHAADVARAGLLALEHKADADPLNVAGSEVITTGDLARLILRLVGRGDTEVVFDPSKPSTIPYRVLDTGKIERVLGFKPAISLEEGLARTIAWYKAQVK